jgi:hypothetical protein
MTERRTAFCKDILADKTGAEQMIFVTTEEAWKEAAKCTEKAEEAFDEEIRGLFLRLRDKWIDIARRAELNQRRG